MLQGYSLRSLMASEQQQQPGARLRAAEEDSEEGGVPSVAGPLLASTKVGGESGRVWTVLARSLQVAGGCGCAHMACMHWTSSRGNR